MSKEFWGYLHVTVGGGGGGGAPDLGDAMQLIHYAFASLASQDITQSGEEYIATINLDGTQYHIECKFDLTMPIAIGIENMINGVQAQIEAQVGALPVKLWDICSIRLCGLSAANGDPILTGGLAGDADNFDVEVVGALGRIAHLSPVARWQLSQEAMLAIKHSNIQEWEQPI